MCSLKITLTLHVQQEPLLPQNVNRLLLNTPEMGNCKRKEKKSFDALDLRYIVIKNCLKTKKELLRFANKQLHEEKTDTTLYILNNTLPPAPPCNKDHGHMLGNGRCNEG